MSVKTKDLRAERARLHTEMVAVVDKAKAEGRAMTTEENATFDRIDADIKAMTESLQREERAAALEKELATAEPVRAGAEDRSGGDDRETAEKRNKGYDKAFDRYRRFGMSELTPEERSALKAGFVSGPEFRAQSTTAAAGGYTIPQGFSNQLEKALKSFSGVLQAVAPWVTEDGATIPWPTYNDTSQTGEQLGENTQAALQDVTFSVVNFDAYMYSSKTVLVSYQLLQDTAFDLDSVLADALGERIGRILNQRLTTGTGSSQPNGFVTAAATGVTLPTGNTTSITYDGVIDLIHSIDPAYRSNPAVAFMMHDTTLSVLKKIKDSQNRPLWQPGMVDGEPDKIFGYRYWINQDMAVPAANAKTIAFGDWSKYKVRQVRGFQLLRLTERYADYLQVGFLGFARYDGDLVNAGTNPLKLLIQSAT